MVYLASGKSATLPIGLVKNILAQSQPNLFDCKPLVEREWPTMFLGYDKVHKKVKISISPRSTLAVGFRARRATGAVRRDEGGGGGARGGAAATDGSDEGEGRGKYCLKL